VSVNAVHHLLATGSTPTASHLLILHRLCLCWLIYSTPTNPVHVDPVSTDIFNSTAFTITTLSLTTFFGHYSYLLESKYHTRIFGHFFHLVS